MACILKQIPKKDCGVIVPPGLKALYTIPYDDITGMAATDKAVPVISKATAKKFIKIPFSRTTGAFVLDYNGETEDSDTILNEFSVFCPQLKPVLHDALESMIGVDMIAVGKTGDGAMLISGDADDPIKLVRIQGGTGTPEAGQKNGYTLTFRRPNSSSLPNFYTGAEADLLVEGA